MTSYNQACFFGRLARDPVESYAAKSQRAVVRFMIAVDRPTAGPGEASGCDWIPCVAYGALGEMIMRRGAKGSEIFAAGKIRTGFYEKEGRKVYTWELQASDVRVWLSVSRTPVQDGGAPESYTSGQDNWTSQQIMEGFTEDNSIAFE